MSSFIAISVIISVVFCVSDSMLTFPCVTVYGHVLISDKVPEGPPLGKELFAVCCKRSLQSVNL